MTKLEIIESLAGKLAWLTFKDVEQAVKIILEHMVITLSSGERVEIRGFGSFELRYRRPRIGRNPKSGEAVFVPAKFIPRFKTGKELRERIAGNAYKKFTVL